jgi:hypothetical protein
MKMIDAKQTLVTSRHLAPHTSIRNTGNRKVENGRENVLGCDFEIPMGKTSYAWISVPAPMQRCSAIYSLGCWYGMRWRKLANMFQTTLCHHATSCPTLGLTGKAPAREPTLRPVSDRCGTPLGCDPDDETGDNLCGADGERERDLDFDLDLTSLGGEPTPDKLRSGT